MGIPVVNLMSNASFAKSNPLAAGLIILAFIVVAVGIYWISRNYPQLWRKVAVGLMAAYLAMVVFGGWQMFKPRPSPVMQIFEEVQEAAKAKWPEYEQE